MEVETGRGDSGEDDESRSNRKEEQASTGEEDHEMMMTDTTINDTRRPWRRMMDAMLMRSSSKTMIESSKRMVVVLSGGVRSGPEAPKVDAESESTYPTAIFARLLRRRRMTPIDGIHTTTILYCIVYSMLCFDFIYDANMTT